MTRNEFCELIELSAERGALRKIVFSRPSVSEVKKVVGRLVEIRGRRSLTLEYSLPGDTVSQKNLSISSLSEELSALLSEYGQANLITSLSDAEYKSGKNGKEVFLGADKLRRRLLSADGEDFQAKIEALDREKNRILTGNEPFLFALGITDKSGRVHDKKQGKFRQINRFLENIEGVYGELRPDGELTVYDLCCGKSYLSFAIYHYFTAIKKREVEMTGVDLKADVIEYCSGVASRLGYDGLTFICGDINEFAPGTEPHLVVSLHACDVATDIVLRYAASHRAGVILSTPCCQRELSSKIDCRELEFVSKYPILRRKMCDALTDSLRLSFLASRGYTVEACELVDPDDTPKNILLRAVRIKNFDPESARAQKLREEFDRTAAFLMGDGNTLTFLK